MYLNKKQVFHSMAPVSVISVLILAELLRHCAAYPTGKLSFKDPDSIPLFLLSLPMEVDEPVRTVEDLPVRHSPGSKTKRNNNIFDSNGADSCCPTVVEVIEPLGGKNRAGDLVELYQGEGVRQRFYEVSCAPHVADHHCQYLDRRHTSHSKCVQQYSYTYALVRDFGGNYDDVENGGWRLDYIQIRSGCACQITPRR